MAVAAQTLPLEAFLLGKGEKSLLRFSTAGSVDDGKSTLIGRLLYETKGAYDDQIEAIKASKINRSSGAIDFSLLTDGLRAEREQGITIDVAYRSFSTRRRRFIIADTPGHEQYTRNMATGASNADVAVILVDARKGVLAQSRRHASISSLLGIRALLIAVNKMDLVGFGESHFRTVVDEFERLRAALGNPELTFIPVSALEGDNVVEPSARMPWYSGPPLLEYLETVEPAAALSSRALRLPVQSVIRPHLDFRGFAGQLVSGSLRAGDAVIAMPQGRASRVKEIVTFDGPLHEAVAPMSVTVTLEDEIDIGRGDLLAHPEDAPRMARRFEAALVWMAEAELAQGGLYVLRHGPFEVSARVTEVRSRIDVETLDGRPAATLGLNDIGVVALETSRPLAYDSFLDNRSTGAFILIDPLSNTTVAAGLIRRGYEQRAKELSTAFQTGPVTPVERLNHFGHTAALLSLSSRPGLLHPLERALFELGCHTLVLDGEWPHYGPLLDAGLLVLTSQPLETETAAVTRDLPEDTEAAVHVILERLRALGVLKTSDQFSQGEGI